VGAPRPDRLTGTKYGCGIEVAGACTVLIDGEPKKSCKIDVGSATGRQVTTIEGLSKDRSHPAQKAWIAHQVPQCASASRACWMSVAGANGRGRHGKEIASEVKNICVCGTYQRAKQAIGRAVNGAPI